MTNEWYVFMNNGKSLNLFKPTGEFNESGKPKMKHFVYKYDRQDINNDRKFLLGKLNSFDIFNPKTGNAVKNVGDTNKKKFLKEVYGNTKAVSEKIGQNMGGYPKAVIYASKIGKAVLRADALISALRTGQKNLGLMAGA
jgi:hypothetical protein